MYLAYSVLPTYIVFGSHHIERPSSQAYETFERHRMPIRHVISEQVFLVPHMTEVVFTDMTCKVLADNLRRTPLPSAFDPFRSVHVLDPMNIFEMFRNALAGNFAAALLGSTFITPQTRCPWV